MGRPRSAYDWVKRSARRATSNGGSLEAELSGVDTGDEGGPFLAGESEGCDLGPLGVADQILIPDLGNLDAGTASAAGALTPFRRTRLIHCGLLSGRVGT